MAFNPIDIERLIMEAHYKQTVSQPSACSGELTDMEREQYQNRIRDLLDAVQTLLDSNKSLGDRLNDTAGKLDQANSQIDTLQNLVSTLQQKINKLEGQKAFHNRTRYGKNSEKSSLSDNDSDKGKTKDQEEEEYIENEGETVGSEDEASLEEESQCEPAESSKRDLSKRPDHYETMHADICVVHECDIDKLSEMGLEFIRYNCLSQLLDNVCERAVRPFTNLRKSFGGFSSERGAQTAARYLTIVETCKLMKKTPLDFFRSFFDMIVEGRRDYENMSQALLCVK